MPVFNRDSLNPLIHLDSHNDWLTLLEICRGWLAESDATSLERYLNGCAKTVSVERNYYDKDYRDTFYNYYAKKFANYPGICIRLSFFNSKIKPTAIWNLSKYNEHFIGFTVIRPTRISSIGRTIFDPRKLSFVHGHIALTEYKIHILGSSLSIEGFPYISQDTDVTICAHASCWMILRHFSERYHVYAEKYPYQITQLTYDIGMGRLVPSSGLTIHQVSEIFSRFGFYPLVYIRGLNTDPILFDRLLYYYVESGLPVAAGMYSKRHAITVIGHFPNIQIPPNHGMNFVNTADLAQGFIINDDNYLPYRMMCRNNAGMNLVYQSEYQVSDIDSFVVPIYEKIYLAAEHVEDLSMEYLSPDSEFTPTKYGINQNDLVVRILLTSSRSYKRFRVLKENRMPNNLDRLYRQVPMPKFIWLVELTTKSLYNAHKVLGEIILDATASPNDKLAFIIIHFPTHLFFHNRDSNNIKENEEFDLHDPLPYNMYASNLKECP